VAVRGGTNHGVSGCLSTTRRQSERQSYQHHHYDDDDAATTRRGHYLLLQIPNATLIVMMRTVVSMFVVIYIDAGHVDAVRTATGFLMLWDPAATIFFFAGLLEDVKNFPRVWMIHTY
jgi:hypothetical protein